MTSEGHPPFLTRSPEGHRASSPLPRRVRRARRPRSVSLTPPQPSSSTEPAPLRVAVLLPHYAAVAAHALSRDGVSVRCVEKCPRTDSHDPSPSVESAGRGVHGECSDRRGWIQDSVRHDHHHAPARGSQCDEPVLLATERSAYRGTAGGSVLTAPLAAHAPSHRTPIHTYS